MTPPKRRTIRVLGEDWTVVRRHINDGTVRGRCDSIERTITLDPDLHGREDFLHEVIHAVEFVLNLDLDEAEVQAIARGLWAIGQDNDTCPCCGRSD